jgi:alkylation response protein AidB-like acyl-CoA dehydrogenase
MSDLNAYRASARAFLESMDAKYGRDARVGNTVEQDLALGREYMAAKHDAGFAGINWPVDMGGQGLTHLHKIAFDGEEMQFGMPVVLLWHFAGDAGADPDALLAWVRTRSTSPGSRSGSDQGAARGRNLVPDVLRTFRRIGSCRTADQALSQTATAGK